jgi:hypothetical protein
MLQVKIKKVILYLLILTLFLILVSATTDGPFNEYLNYNYNFEFVRGATFVGSAPSSVECIDSKGNTYEYTTESTIDWIKYTCHFNYVTPSSGKGVDNIDFILKSVVSEQPYESNVIYNLYYGYCPIVSCSDDTECINHECILICGDGEKDPGETCSNCPQDVVCKSYEKCEDNVCKVFCGNGKIDDGENCLSCPQDAACESYEQCNNIVCEGYCGNGKPDSGENCKSCPEDIICGLGHLCAEGGHCVLLGTSKNCAFLGDSCGEGYCVSQKCVECRKNEDCESKQIYGEGFICSPSKTNVLEKGHELSGLCKNGNCNTKKVDITPRVYKDCNNTGCQDGHCGCSNGYKLCGSILECKKYGILNENIKCNCDFECKSGYCSDNNKCINTLDVILSANKHIIKVGEQTRVTLSVGNNLNKIVNTNLAIDIGNGFDITSVDGGMDCSGNQCKSFVEIPEKDRKTIILELEGKTAIVGSLSAEVVYFMDDKIERTIPNINNLEITVSNCGDKKCTAGETPQNCCQDCKCIQDKILSTNVCKENTCNRKLKKGFSIFFLLIALGIFIVVYKIFHPHVIDIVKTKKLKFEHCPNCNKHMEVGKTVCSKCSKSVKYKKKHVNLLHLFEKDEELKSKKKAKKNKRRKK